MTPISPQSPISPTPSIRVRSRGVPHHERRRNDLDRSTHKRAGRPLRSALGRYRDSSGCAREVIARPGSAGSVLVIDRDAATGGDRRLVAHLAADEPAENAAVVCESFIADARAGGTRCRSLTAEDLHAAPLPERDPAGSQAATSTAIGEAGERLDRTYRLERLFTGMSIPELRWCRCSSTHEGDLRAVSVREVIASLERYEPIYARTAEALACHAADPAVSTAVLRIELARMQTSPIVLNRSLREAVTRALARDGSSMSEIAMRCGRIKRDAAGNESGETSWLARRLGILPEAGRAAPTPWVHSDVLGLIARDGLGVCPREVEVE